MIKKWLVALLTDLLTEWILPIVTLALYWIGILGIACFVEKTLGHPDIPGPVAFWGLIVGVPCFWLWRKLDPDSPVF